MTIPTTTYHPKLARLAEIEGFGIDVDALIESALRIDAYYAICTDPDCDHTEDMEPDQLASHCPECDAGTMQSALVLADLI